MATDKSTEDLEVTLSLDDLEREQVSRDKIVRKPYVVVLNGKKYVFTDPQEIDWLDLASIEDDPARFLGLCLDEERSEGTVDEFYAARVPGWKINAMTERFLSHYGVTRQGNRFASRR